MTGPHHWPCRKRRAGIPSTPRGLTLPELLVSIALGLAVLLAGAALLLSANRSYVAQVEAATLDEGGRYAVEAISRAVRQAAWVDWEGGFDAAADPAMPARLAGLDTASVSKSGAGIDNPLDDAVNGSDVLAVRFPGAGKPPDGDGSVLDCGGFPVHQHAEGWSIFYVARSGAGEAELRCKYKGKGGWSADAVATGVDTFQVLYGLDTDEPADGVPNRYVNASAIGALDAALVLAGADEAERARDLRKRTYWKRIASVHFSLLLHAGGRSPDTTLARTYDLFGPAYGESLSVDDPGTRLSEDELAAAAGRRERRVVSATVALPKGAR